MQVWIRACPSTPRPNLPGLSAAKVARATRLFRALDVDRNDHITSGAVYKALSQLDPTLTEQQLDYAASLRNTFLLSDLLDVFARLERGDDSGAWDRCYGIKRLCVSLTHSCWC